MTSQKNKEIKNKIRIAILVVVGVISFVVAVGMNIVGMKDAIEKKPDSSGMAGFSVRTKKSDSLGNIKETKVDKDGKIAEENILVNSVPIIKLNNNGWERVKANFTGFELDENGTAIFEDGYKLFCNGKYVNYVLFDSTYKSEVVGHLKVGTDFKTIEKKLGEPTFKTKECLGYKTKEVYVFFYEDEVAVYTNRKISNKDLENLFKSYLEKAYSRGRTYFLVEIRNDYPDFTIKMNEETDVVTITSVARQVTAKLDSLGNIEVEFYNGYNIATEETKEFISKNRYKTNEEDLVEIVEDERVSVK